MCESTIARMSSTPKPAASSAASRWCSRSYLVIANSSWTIGGHSSGYPAAAPVSNSTGPTFGCSISAAIIATSRRGEAGAGSERVLTPAAASGQPSSYSRKPRSSRCSFTAILLLRSWDDPRADTYTTRRDCARGPAPALALQRRGGVQPCRLELLALGRDRAEVRGQLGEPEVIGRLLGHR